MQWVGGGGGGGGGVGGGGTLKAEGRKANRKAVKYELNSTRTRNQR